MVLDDFDVKISKFANYIVKHFDIEARENLSTGANRGIYTAADGGVETKDSLVIAPGKAYVNGYEIETQTSSILNFDKASVVFLIFWLFLIDQF